MSQLEFARRRPAPPPVVTAAELRAGVPALVDRALAGLDANEVVRASARQALARVTPDVFQQAANFANAQRDLVRNAQWYWEQRTWSMRVELALAEGFVAGAREHFSGRAQAVSQARGAWVSAAHLQLAASTPSFPGLQQVFLVAAIYKMTTDTLQTLGQLVRAYQRPQELALDLLRAAHWLLDLAFAAEADGLQRANGLGRSLAQSLVESMEQALFPDPLGPDGQEVFGPAQSLIRAAHANGLDIVTGAASFVMVPWTWGKFIGPMALELALAILSFVVPGGALAQLLRSLPRVERVLAIVDSFIDGAGLARRAQRLQRLPDAPDVTGSGARAVTPSSVPGDRAIQRSGASEAPPLAEQPSSPGPGHVEPTHAPDGSPPGDGGPTDLPDALPDGSPMVEGLRRSLTALSRRGVDVNDPYTLEYLDDMFRRFRSSDVQLMTTRADAGELRALIRYADQPGVERVRFLRPGRAKGDRTPDIEVLRQGQAEFVEVRTLTQAPRGAVTGSRARVELWLTDQSIASKIFRGQVSDAHPGTIVFHAPFGQVTQHWRPTWQGLLHDIFESQPSPSGLRRIEVTTGTLREMLVFEPPDWVARTVSR